MWGVVFWWTCVGLGLFVDVCVVTSRQKYRMWLHGGGACIWVVAVGWWNLLIEECVCFGSRGLKWHVRERFRSVVLLVL